MELDLKIFMSQEVPSPNAKPSPMLATNRYRNLARMATTVEVFSTSVPFRACRWKQTHRHDLVLAFL